MEEKQYIGVDIGGTAVKTGIVDASGLVSMKSETEIDTSCKSETVIETVIRSIHELIAISDISARNIAGMGVSSPGSINSGDGSVAMAGGNVPGWGGTPICKMLEGEFGIPVSVANDGNCVALAEAWIGAASGCDNVICAVIGTGFGGGIISGGRLIEGNKGYAGEIGHMVTHAGGRECVCGGRGCFEKYAATSALVSEAMKINSEWSSGRKLFGEANKGNKDALELIDKWTDEAAYGIAGLVHIFNPEIILIGGGVSAQEELVVDPIREKVMSLIMPDFADGLTIRRAMLGNDAGMVGAVRHLIYEYRERKRIAI